MPKNPKEEFINENILKDIFHLTKGVPVLLKDDRDKMRNALRDVLMTVDFDYLKENKKNIRKTILSGIRKSNFLDIIIIAAENRAPYDDIPLPRRGDTRPENRREEAIYPIITDVVAPIKDYLADPESTPINNTNRTGKRFSADKVKNELKKDAPSR